MAARTFEEMTEAMKKLATHMAEESKRTDTHWDEIADNIVKASKEYNKGFLGAFSRLTDTHRIVHNIASTLAGGLTSNRAHLEEMAKQYGKLYAMYDKARDITKPPSRQRKAVRDQYELVKAASAELEIHRKLHDNIAQIVGSRMGPAYAAVVGSLALAVQYSKTINQDLIQASATVRERSSLMHDISNVQAETGNEMKDMAKAAASLLKYGFDVKGNFRDTLAIVVKMEEGLGVSYETSAEMAVMMQRLGTNLRSVADGIARVKADTALSAEQATKFATEIAKAINLLKPGSGTLADQVIEYVNRLSGALQQVGGNASDIKDLLIGFTQERGMMGAATLGATPDFLADPARARQVTERFVQYVNTQLAGTAGFQRMATIQMLAQQFGTTADLIANADKMLESYNTTTKHATNLQEEWRMQTSEIGKTLSKIIESGRAIIQQTLIPMLQIIRPGLAVVADVFQTIAKHSWTAYAAMTALAVVVGSAIVEFYSLGASILFAVRASQAYRLMQAGRAATAIGGGPLVTLLRFWLPKIGTWLGGITLAATAGYVVGTLIEKGLQGTKFELAKYLKTGEDRRMEFRNQTAAMRGGTSYATVMSGVSSLISHGASSAEVQAYLLKQAHNIPAIYGAKSEEDRQKMISGLIGSVGNIITTQRAAIKYAGLTEQSEEDKNRQKVLIELFKSVAMNTQLQNKLMEHAGKKHEIISEQDRQIEEQFERDRQLEKAVDRGYTQGWGFGGVAAPKF